jgi:hypothetical protein
MRDNRIVDFAPYGEHIDLTCVHHPSKRWSTKNIAPIGARSIFYNLDMVPGMGPECSCSGRDLRPLTEEEAIADLYEKEAS